MDYANNPQYKYTPLIRFRINLSSFVFEPIIHYPIGIIIYTSSLTFTPLWGVETAREAAAFNFRPRRVLASRQVAPLFMRNRERTKGCALCEKKLGLAYGVVYEFEGDAAHKKPYSSRGLGLMEPLTL